MSNLRLLVEKNVVLVSTLIVILGIIVTAFNVDIKDTQSSPTTSNSDWQIKTFTNVSGLEAPALLENAMIWHPAGESVLVYEPLGGKADTIRYEWIVGIPRDWQVIQANDQGDQHLIWLNTDGRLLRSEINEHGEQLLAPVAVGGFNVVDFGGIYLDNGFTLIWWQAVSGINKGVYTVLVDERGRPFEELHLLQDAERFALTKQGDQIHLTWINDEVAGAYLLHYAEISVDEVTATTDIETASTNLQISTDVGEWIDSLDIISNAEETHMIWGIMEINNPDYAHFHGAVWEDGQSEPITFTLNLEDATKLRWIGRLNSQQRVTGTQLVLNAFWDGQWRAVLVELDGENVTSYKVIGQWEANASRAHVWIDADGQITAAWAAIQDQTIVHQVVSNRADLISLQETNRADENTFGEMLLKWFLNLPYGVLWLLLPLAALIGLERNQVIGPTLQIILILIVYWLGKLLVHGEVLNTPPSFAYTDSDAVTVGVALGSCALVAGAIAQRIWRMDFNWRTVLAVFLIGDAVITFLIFGASLG